MKNLLVSIMLLATVTIYKGSSIVPSYTIEKGPVPGTYKVYPAGRPVVPLYIIKDNKVFPAGRPVIPLFTIEKKKKGGGNNWQ